MTLIITCIIIGWFVCGYISAQWYNRVVNPDDKSLGFSVFLLFAGLWGLFCVGVDWLINMDIRPSRPASGRMGRIFERFLGIKR